MVPASGSWSSSSPRSSSPTPLTSAYASSSSSDKDFQCSLPTPFYPPSLLRDLGDQAATARSDLSLPVDLPALPDTSRPREGDPADKGTPDEWVVRDKGLVRLTGRHPFNAEAELTPLFDAGFLTPARLFYVRNHGPVPRVSQQEALDWTVQIDGLCARPCTLSMNDLIDPSKFQTVTLPATMVCAGNRRKEQNVVRKSLGFSWGPAGLSTALWTGVYLADVLDYVQPTTTARHVIFEGAEDLPDGKYGTSQKIGRARRRDQAMMLCWAMNGETLEPDHGYPLRLVVPGQIGGRSVKWLKKITLSDRESQHHLHFHDNKVLPASVMPEQARRERHWWYDPRYIINDLNTNSVIAHPAHDEQVQLAASEKSYTLKGYAYAGGGRRVTRVDVSLDGGQTWQLADIDYPEDRYRSHIVQSKTFGLLDLATREESFCWAFWQLDIDLTKLELHGSICVRAGDEGLSGQPDTMVWNATGMMNNSWFRVAAHLVEADNGARAVRFEHPTQPGLMPGGWMQRKKDADEDILHPSFTAAPSQPDLDIKRQAIEKAKKPVIVMTKPGLERKITQAELAQHSNDAEPWFVVNGEVYDATPFLRQHPGGPESITIVAGQDATDDFMAIHSSDAKSQLAEYHIGALEAVLAPTQSDTSAYDPPEAPFLNKKVWKKVELVSVTKVNHDSRVFRFALDRPDRELGLPTGQHVYARLRRKACAGDAESADDTAVGEVVQRAYTPISDDKARGYIDFLIKVYHRSAEFPDGGKMTLGFEELEVGDTIELKGPLGSLQWLDGGIASYRGQQRRVRKVGLIAAGSGITPIYQVLRAISHCREPIEVDMINANKTETDILLREELALLAESLGTRLRMHFILSKAPCDGGQSTGRITSERLAEKMPKPGPDTMIFACGPDPLIVKTVRPGLHALGFDLEKDVVVF